MAETFSENLTSAQAALLLLQHGPNEIKESGKFTWVRSLMAQFSGFLMLLLIGAGVVSFAIGETIDAVFIFLIVILNSMFGFYQEFKAEQSLKALKLLTVSTVRVVRDGQEQEIDSRHLVPGDLIYLEQGSMVPADAQILQSRNLQINEASLTGESLPIEKDAADEERNRLFMGTTITRGRGFARITETGGHTKFGMIASTLASIEKGKTPMQKKLEVFTKQVGVAGLIAAVVVFGLSFIHQKSLVESFIFAVSLAVAAVPEGLPAVMTITLAIGVERMARKKAIVRKLNSIETLGAVTLLATDKTGTLTTNKMKVKKMWLEYKNYEANHAPQLSNRTFWELIHDGILCSTASLVYKENHGSAEVLGDTTEGAVLLLANDANLDPETVKSEWEILDETPFDQVTKRMITIVKKAEQVRVFIKGAPEAILSGCEKILVDGVQVPLSVRQKEEITMEFQNYAKKGLRVLAFSYKEKLHKPWEKDQVFLGFVGLADPVRAEVKEAVMTARGAGIRVVMVTGDNQMTARAVGIETGIFKEGEDILTGDQLDEFSDRELLEILPRVTIFARTTPDHKYKLVRLFQQLGHVVAVTGDGVNDVLAIKQADVGVAMGLTGTDVARETADIVITDDNFASLVSAVDEGRSIFNRIKNAIKFLLACNLGEVIYILSATAFGLPLLSPLQILYMNLVTDGLPAICLAFSPRDHEVMREKPKSEGNILTKKDLHYLLGLGGLTALLCYISTVPAVIFKYAVSAETLLFTTIIFVQHFVLVDAWLSHHSIVGKLARFKNPVFLAAFFLPILVHPVLLYTPQLNIILKTRPLSLLQLIYAMVVSGLMMVFLEMAKVPKIRHLFRLSV